MFFDDSNAIIVSSGHLNTYIGYATDEIPSYQGLSYYSTYSGKSQYLERLGMNLARGARVQPFLSNNQIVSPEEYLKFVSCLVSKFNDEIPEHPMLILNKEAPNLVQNRKKMAELLFETYYAPCIYFGNESVTGLFSTGSFNGVLIDSGTYSTTISPIYDGCLLKKSRLIRRGELGCGRRDSHRKSAQAA